MGAEFSKTKTAIGQRCANLTRRPHISPLSDPDSLPPNEDHEINSSIGTVSLSSSQSRSNPSQNPTTTTTSHASASNPSSSSRKFFKGRWWTRPSANNYPREDFPVSQWSFWRDYEANKNRRTHNLSHTLSLLVQEILGATFGDTLHLAPVSEILQNGGNILDLGCGNASWSSRVCARYPDSQVTGYDLTNNLITGNVPKNFTFQKGDSLYRLPFPDGTFDLVYSNGLLSHTTQDRTDTLVAELIRVIRPGGHFELVENDVRSHKTGPKLSAILQLLSFPRANYDPNFLSTLPIKLSSHPELVFVQTDYLYLEIGPKDGSSYLVTRALLQSMEVLSAKPLGLEKKGYEKYVEDCLEECCTEGTAHVAWVGWGQKSRLA